MMAASLTALHRDEEAIAAADECISILPVHCRAAIVPLWDWFAAQGPFIGDPAYTDITPNAQAVASAASPHFAEHSLSSCRTYFAS